MRFLILVLCFPCLVFAKPAAVSLGFNAVPLNDLVRVLYSQIIKKPFIADDDFIKETRQVSLYLPDRNPDSVRSLLVGMLKGYGYAVVEDGGITKIEKLRPPAEKIEQPEPQDVFIYRPRFRSVSYLVDLIRPFVSVTTERALPVDDKTKAALVGASDSSAAALADKQADTLVYKGPVSTIKRLRGLISQLDVAPRSVLVRAAIYEVSSGESKANAFKLLASVLDSKLGITLGAPVLSDAVSIKTGHFESVLSALDTDNHFKLLSNPTIRVLSGSSGRFQIGNQVPTLGAIQYDSNGRATQSVEYRDSGIILDVQPSVYSDRIDLNIDQRLSNFVKTDSGVNNSPTLVVRQVTSKVNLQPGEIIVLGSLNESKTTKTRSGLSWLPSWLGAKSADNSDSEFLLVITAELV